MKEIIDTEFRAAKGPKRRFVFARSQAREDVFWTLWFAILFVVFAVAMKGGAPKVAIEAIGVVAFLTVGIALWRENRWPPS